MEHCEVPRWVQLKGLISNLNYADFLNKSEELAHTQLLDVRTLEEFNLDTLPDAKNLDYLSKQLADELEKLDPDCTYFVFCRTGRRSLRVCVLLHHMGYKVYNLDGGLSSVR